MTISNEHIVTLQTVKGIGPVAISKICDKVNTVSCDSISLEELYQIIVDMVKGKEVTRVTLPSFEDLENANRIAKRILSQSEEKGIKAVSRFEDTFPKMLHGTVSEDGKPSVPTLLYYMGDLSITQKPALAVIGTREPTPEGERAGHYYGDAFASIGINIVSGLAMGCDTAAHRGALDAGGATTAFLANGLDSIYPSENASLAREIIEKGGLLLSEYPIGTVANRYNLVARDRLQAGLSNSTLVIQSGVKGGTMHAVASTQAAGKNVFAVEYGSNLGDKTEGNAYLIGNGATGLRVRKEDILSNPNKYIALIKGTNSEDKQQEYKTTLF